MVLVASYSDPRSSPQRRFFSLGVGVAARHTRAHVDVRRQAPCVVAGCGIGSLGGMSGRAGEAGSSFRWELGRYDRTVLTPGLSFWLCLHNTHTCLLTLTTRTPMVGVVLGLLDPQTRVRVLSLLASLDSH